MDRVETKEINQMVILDNLFEQQKAPISLRAKLLDLERMV